VLDLIHTILSVFGFEYTAFLELVKRPRSTRALDLGQPLVKS
jgi:hypothetical protein